MLRGCEAKPCISVLHKGCMNKGQDCGRGIMTVAFAFVPRIRAGKGHGAWVAKPYL